MKPNKQKQRLHEKLPTTKTAKTTTALKQRSDETKARRVAHVDWRASQYFIIYSL